TPVMVPASCGVYSGAEPSGLSGSDEMLRNGVSARPAGAFCAAGSEAPSAESEASAPADSCMDLRRVICMSHLLHADSLLQCGSVVEEKLAHFAAIGPATYHQLARLTPCCLPTRAN